MKDCLYTILVGFFVTMAVAAVILGARILIDRREQKKLEKQWRGKGATHNRRKWISGEVDQGFMRGIAELGFLILLLLVLFGWMGYSHQ